MNKENLSEIMDTPTKIFLLSTGLLAAAAITFAVCYPVEFMVRFVVTV
jgi:hypothetical protein